MTSPQAQEWIGQTVAFVKDTLAYAEGGHDWWHVYRVWQTVKHIGALEKANMLVVELAALLHDIADAKFHGGSDEAGPQKARAFLESIGLPAVIAEEVVQIVANVSFKGGKEKRTFSSLALDVVQDADRLDAMGAIGIARAFNYGGFKNRAIYDPAIPPNLYMDKAAYRKSNAPTLNHFYEKLLLLKDMMNTPSGKAMAHARHAFLEGFLAQFHAEWSGEC